jgi:type VI secretion system protein ImpD
MLDRDIAEIDAVLSQFANSVLHHPRFQAIEAAWRGIHWLTGGLGADGMTAVRVLDCRWNELARDLDRAPEFDQSALFGMIYNEEFDMPGGVPVSMLVGLYDVQHRPSRGHPTDDVAVMRKLADVAAAAFCPIFLGVTPALLGVDRMGELDLRQSIGATFRLPEYNRLQSFQQTLDARFIGLVAPRVLMRAPYRGRSAGDCGFRFDEICENDDDQLWAPGALAIAHLCLRAFNEHRWLAAIRGTVTDSLAGGVITALPSEDFETDSPGIAPKFSIEVNLSDALEREMAEAGMICIRRCKDTPHLAVFNLPSLHRPKGAYPTDIARANEQLGAMLNYILCVARFAHYIKVIALNWVGSYKSAEDCQARLQKWLNGFCAGGSLSYEMKARYPLETGRIMVRDVPGKPGSYECTVALKPHFQLDQAISEFQLVTSVNGVEHQL